MHALVLTLLGQFRYEEASSIYKKAVMMGRQALLLLLYRRRIVAMS